MVIERNRFGSLGPILEPEFAWLRSLSSFSRSLFISKHANEVAKCLQIAGTNTIYALWLLLLLLRRRRVSIQHTQREKNRIRQRSIDRGSSQGWSLRNYITHDNKQTEEMCYFVLQLARHYCLPIHLGGLANSRSVQERVRLEFLFIDTLEQCPSVR